MWVRKFRGREIDGSGRSNSMGGLERGIEIRCVYDDYIGDVG